MVVLIINLLSVNNQKLKFNTMKKLFFILTCIIPIITANANTLDFKISNVYFKILPKGLGENKGIYHAPSSNEKIIFSYDLQNKSIILEPQYEMDDVQVIITKNGETIAEESFNISEEEQLECDMFDCESGEYNVYILVSGEMQLCENVCIYF